MFCKAIASPADRAEKVGGGFSEHAGAQTEATDPTGAGK